MMLQQRPSNQSKQCTRVTHQRCTGRPVLWVQLGSGTKVQIVGVQFGPGTGQSSLKNPKQKRSSQNSTCNMGWQISDDVNRSNKIQKQYSMRHEGCLVINSNKTSRKNDNTPHGGYQTECLALCLKRFVVKQKDQFFFLYCGFTGELQT